MTEQQTPPSVPAHKPTSKKRLAIYAVAVLIIIGALGYCTMSRDKGSNMAGQRGGMGMNNGPQPVQAAQAVKGDMPVYLTGLGTVTAANTVTVRSQVDGPLQRLHFKEGDTVSAGQLLAEVDPRPFQVQLAQAQGQLAKDEASLASARADLARYQQLLSQDSIARQQVDTQRSLVRQLEGSIKSDRAQVASANLQLTYSRVSAPFAGRAGLRQVDPGNLIRSGDASGIVVITQVQPINVMFSLPEAQLTQVLDATRGGQLLAVQAGDRSMGKLLATGELVSLDNQIDTATGTIKLKAQFANQDNMLFPNQFVNVRIKVATLSQAVIVPVAAVQHGSKGSFVWVVGKDSKVAVKNVKTGAGQDERIAIVSGLAAGERVVTDGVDRLREGAQVEVVTPGKAPSGEQKPKREGTRRGAGNE